MTNATNRYETLHMLSSRQLKALEVIDAGGTHVAAAAEAGVDRTTVSRWVNHHPAFIAEMNLRKDERLREWENAIDAATRSALDTIAAGLEASDTNLAVRWLQLVGVSYLTQRPQGATTAAGVIEGFRSSLSFKDELSELLGELDGRTSEAAMNAIVEELGDAVH